MTDSAALLSLSLSLSAQLHRFPWRLSDVLNHHHHLAAPESTVSGPCIFLLRIAVYRLSVQFGVLGDAVQDRSPTKVDGVYYVVYTAVTLLRVSAWL